MEQIALERRAIEEQMELEKQRAAQSLLNSERVQFRQAEYQVCRGIHWSGRIICVC
jgi:hypothetical protein